MDTAAPDRKGRATPLWRHPSTRRRIRVQLGKIGRIRTQMIGLPCTACGSTKYQVVLQPRSQATVGPLVGRCTRCESQRDLEKEGLRAAVLFRYGLQMPDDAHPLS